MKNMVVASTSTVHGSGYLEYLLPALEKLFENVDTVTFIPYARPGGIDHDAYTAIAAKGLAAIGKKVRGLHTYQTAEEGVLRAEALFTGGGNTFLLVHELYRNGVMEVLRKAIYRGLPYLGTSAGSNITGLSMQTTNDMPIIYPPSFKTLGALPFNLNPHYLDPVKGSTHMGETRETRIKEFHTINHIPVVGLREGSWLEVKGDDVYLRGDLTARIFEKDVAPFETEPGKKIYFES
ncbi:dipeptidase PepE [Robertkochia marina]|uniref:Dipeptidase PepE n=1 Tax=Robertkochia marina TaxID=1227945 RepID=A0A4S3LY16_9FLAO|nr:dipeptidase PepE [Robertkochia marina]THD66326.1 dipeptidase PepE [Robertkochia marina]TRZ41247.1 dipeptidase PepE [Robertkochia marina]